MEGESNLGYTMASSIDSAFNKTHKRNTSIKSRSKLLDLLQTEEEQLYQDFNYINTNPSISPSSSSTLLSNESAENIPFDSHLLNKLHIDHHYLLQQNKTLSKELQFAKLTAQALRNILNQKEEQLMLLAQQLSNKASNSELKREGSQNRIKLPFRNRSH
ncbi:hypothetical protein K502DRAFT_340133 [Neoconidiobolus thromboides FSU 785]|nr:hypothetical protein K502DRAFT_340133 [Neoconidiobolus thromboides FSU 785]